MDSKVSQYFLEQLRHARAEVDKDSEAVSEVLFVVERLGSYLKREIGTLSTYRAEIQHLACGSALARELPEHYPSVHIAFYRLYEIVMQARNDALHQGAYVRHLTHRAIELSIVLEDALMNNLKIVAEFMVRDPLCCSFWQPISFIRQQMLTNSFSFLPVQMDDKSWGLVSDVMLARFLRVKSDVRKNRLNMTLLDATSSTTDDHMKLLPPRIVNPLESIEDVSVDVGHVPAIVTRDGGLESDIIGIITAFDLL